MACSLEACLSGSVSTEAILRPSPKRFLRPYPVGVGSLQFADSYPKYFGAKLILDADHAWTRDWKPKACIKSSVHAQSSTCVSRSQRWWEKNLKPNMVEVHSAQELVDSLLHPDDRLVIVNFYSPGCGGCRALHPKICQLAESYPNAFFLKVNYEELQKTCHCLQIHVLPFFRFYRGAEGRLCSFSCTTATIKKFKDALAKYGTGSSRCSLAPPKGLDETELLKLASIGEISLNLPFLTTREGRMEHLFLNNIDRPDW